MNISLMVAPNEQGKRASPYLKLIGCPTSRRGGQAKAMKMLRFVKVFKAI
jgi:hypothetical protein